MLTLYILNSESSDYIKYQIKRGQTLEDVAKFVYKKGEPIIVAALVDNVMRELTYTPNEESKISFITMKSLDGVRIYQRSLSFLFIRAIKECFNGINVRIEHSLSGGLFCQMSGIDGKLKDEDYKLIENKMKNYIDVSERFIKKDFSVQEAKKIFESHNMLSKMELLKYRKEDSISLYKCGELYDYFYGYMVPDASYVNCFELKPFNDGVILRHPTTVYPNELPPFVPQPKLESVFEETEKWANIARVGYVADLNEMIESGRVFDMMKIVEALHEKKIAQIADQICAENKRIILIAGPSSSGKTTFANRLKVQLQVNGLRPITISTDDYFVEREFTPRDENGDYDFESIESVDTDLFNRNLKELIKGKEVDMPIFDFKVGKKRYGDKKLQIGKDQPVIIEGIHGLNEKLTSSIAKRDKFKIYISALTQLNIDEHNRIPTTDTRLIRRIVRDSRDRGHSAIKTINMWSSVRRGEEHNIFPFQEEADAMFNSALPYELSVLKKYAMPLLENIDENSPESVEVKRLIKLLNYFISIEDESYIPYTSILKEFIG